MLDILKTQKVFLSVIRDSLTNEPKNERTLTHITVALNHIDEKLKELERTIHADFMSYFKSDEFSQNLQPDEGIELFKHSLLGSSDLTVELLSEVITNYGGSVETGVTAVKTELYDQLVNYAIDAKDQDLLNQLGEGLDDES